MNGQNVLKAFNEGLKYLDNANPGTLNRIMQVGDKFLRVITKIGSDEIFQIQVAKTLDPSRFTPYVP